MPGLEIFTVYENSSDNEKKFVIRSWYIGKDMLPTPQKIVFKSNDYEEIKEFLEQKGLNNIGRMHEKDPVIKESWV